MKRPKRIAEKLKLIRQHLGVSQSGLIPLINFNGHYGRISEYERAKRIPGIPVLLTYARAAKVPLEEIVDDELDLNL